MRLSQRETPLIPVLGNIWLHTKRGAKRKVRQMACSEKFEEKLSPGLCFITCRNFFFQYTKLMTLSQGRVVRRERTPLILWNSRLRCTNTVLPCCWSHLTKLLYISEGLWYCTHIHGRGPSQIFFTVCLFCCSVSYSTICSVCAIDFTQIICVLYCLFYIYFS